MRALAIYIDMLLYSKKNTCTKHLSNTPFASCHVFFRYENSGFYSLIAYVHFFEIKIFFKNYRPHILRLHKQVNLK